jgi:uncharacterized protein
MNIADVAVADNNLKKIIFTFLALTVFNIWAEDISYEYGEKSFLWEASAKNGNSVFILGSIHYGTKELYPLPYAVQSSFRQSEVLVVESDILNLNTSKMQQLMVKYVVFPEEQTLSNNISRGTFEILKKRLNAFGFTMESMSNYKPWFIGLTMAAKEVIDRGFSEEFGIDRHFLRLADDLGKQIKELEGMEFQFKLLSEFDAELQEEFLKMTLKNQSYNLNGAFNAWIKADPQKMEQFLIDEMSKTLKLQSLYDELFYERNIRMCFKIDEYVLSEKKHFVVVGAGHLVGERGILKILRKKGYKVKQL